jgi:hypothetical protein
LIRRALLALAVVATASPTRGQTPDLSAAGQSVAQSSVEFLSRAVFHMGAERLSGNDIRFTWDANLGGELDFVDYGAGRATFAGNYQVILGDEFKAFDPNQGNYVLEGSLSGRLPALELAAVFYHQSRHLSDRQNMQPIDWNMLGVRAMHAWIAGAAMHLDARADLRWTILRTFVDYTWEFDGRLRADRVLRPGVGLLLVGGVRHLGVDGTQNRGGQTGVRGEAGVRFDGAAAAVELFVAGERRIDPYPLEFSAKTWITAGFRLLSQ